MDPSTDWPNLSSDHPLALLCAELESIIAEADYCEVYGIELNPPIESSPAKFATLLILQKFLRANANDVSKARAQLLGTLKWRKDFQPLKVANETFERARFGGLGYVTQLSRVPASPNATDVATFNIYGAVKNTTKTFGDLDGFIRWRVALMELTLSHLHMSEAKIPIPDHDKGLDPYQAVQIHDHLNVSFLRQPAEVKAASQKTIKLFSDYYPETLSRKYFVNVPLVMQWMFTAMRPLMPKATVEKMVVVSYGTELYKYLGSSVPKAYGGQSGELGEVGKELNLDTQATTASKA
ncbi:Phosphatidylinositol transfer protein sfh5 [Elasticomyces elasticus]|nr:Phosphatidylinositol transfer protein sfh5 [Elasticomyces elasticus]KAK5009223.1 hypothetical protein LTR28_002082 [Elasticomyces elasticus]